MTTGDGRWMASSASRVAVLSMDIEDWYHVGYLDRGTCDERYSMLDGLDVYLELLARHGVRSSFFCTGDVAPSLASRLRDIHHAGHEVGSHTETHRRPLELSVTEFDAELSTSKRKLEDLLGAAVAGFRAPAFSLDDARLARVREAGFLYDSSKIAFRGNPMYGTIRLDGFEQVRPFVFRDGEFVEFEMSTVRVLGQVLPVSGGGYLRLLPWWLMRSLVRKHLATQTLYTLYIHPYELSRRAAPPRPRGLGWTADRRFRTGLGGVEAKLDRLVAELVDHDFAFTTFQELRDGIVAAAAPDQGAAASRVQTRT